MAAPVDPETALPWQKLGVGRGQGSLGESAFVIFRNAPGKGRVHKCGHQGGTGHPV